MQSINALLEVMRNLRSKNGCDWDKEQTHESLIKYLKEESNELIDAIAEGDFFNIKEELGDVLFQIIFHSQIAQESGEFDFNDVVTHITQKMIRRHPHVFSTVKYASPEEQKAAWQAIKEVEKTEKTEKLMTDIPPHFDHLLESSILDKIKMHHSAMDIAIQMQSECAKVGFDWENIADVFQKLDEEAQELKVEISNQKIGLPEHIEEEFGDLMFVMMNLARHLKLDPEIALRKSNQKFKKRFQYIEKSLSQKGTCLAQATLEEMELLWIAAKKTS